MSVNVNGVRSVCGEAINRKTAVFDDGADLINAGCLIVLAALIEVSQGQHEKQEKHDLGLRVRLCWISYRPWIAFLHALLQRKGRFLRKDCQILPANATPGQRYFQMNLQALQRTRRPGKAAIGSERPVDLTAGQKYMEPLRGKRS